MEQIHSIHIAASRQAVWNALTDPAVLRRCIPQCETLTPRPDDPHTLDTQVLIALGPLKARFSGVLAFTHLDEPEHYRFEGAGKGGVAGVAGGWAEGRLVDLGAEGTRIDYQGHATLEGRIASLGGGLVDRFADTLLRAFFERLDAVLTGRPLPEEAKAAANTDSEDGGAAKKGLSDRLPGWMGGKGKDGAKDKKGAAKADSTS